MSDDDTFITVDPSPQDGGPDPRDDWLGSSPDLDWFQDGEERPEQPRRRGVAAARVGFGGSDVPLDPEVRRRRLVAAAVGMGAVVLVVVIALVAFGGGGTKKPVTTPITTPGVTTPATTGTTPPATTTTKTTAPLRVVLPASGKLSQGDTGADVKLLQRALVKLAVATLTPDGNFGAATESAVAAFQQVHDLTADGVVGAKTAQAINTALTDAG
jgi:hypothetical protein